MGRIRFALSGTLFWVILLLSIFFCENVPLLSVSKIGFDTFTFFFISGLIVGLLLVYYFIEHTKNKLKIDFVLLPILLIFLACGIIAIWVVPEVNTIDNVLIDPSLTSELVVSTSDKLHATIQFSIAVIVIYTLIFVNSRTQFRYTKIMWFAYIFVAYTLLTCLLTFPLNMDAYKSLINEGKETADGVCSIYHNVNMFAGALFIGMFACAFINLKKGRWLSYFLMLVFYVQMFFTGCTTTLALSTVFLPIYYLVEIIRSYRQHPIRNTFVSIFYIAAFVGVFLLYHYASSGAIPKLNGLVKYLNENIVNKNLETFTGRTDVWKQAWHIISSNQTTLIFGHGYNIGTMFLKSSFALRGVNLLSCHNGLLEVMLSYGIIGLSLYGLAILYFIYCCIRLMIRKEHKIAWYSLITVIFLLTRSMFESFYFFSMSVEGITTTFLFVLPVIVMHKQYKHPKLQKEVATANVWQKGINHNYLARLLTSFCVFVLLMIGVCFMTRWTYESDSLKPLLLYILFATLIFLPLTPYLLSLFYKKSTLRRFFIRIIIHTLILGGLEYGVYALGTYVLKFTKVNYYFNYIFVFVLYELILLIVYGVIKKGSFKEWFVNLIRGLFVTTQMAPILTFVFGGIPIILCANAGLLDNLSLLMMMIMCGCIYYLIVLFAPFKENMYMLQDLNDTALFKLRKDVYFMRI